MIRRFILSYKSLNFFWSATIGRRKLYINYFFKEVIPQLLEYFESNAKEMPDLLILEVLKNNNYKNEIQDVNDLSEKISEKYEESSSEIH